MGRITSWNELSNGTRSNRVVTTNRICLLACVYGITALISSFFVQYAWGIPACRLCILQRFIAALLCGAGLLGYLTARKKTALVFVTTTLAIGWLAAVYHGSVQAGWINDPCKINLHVNTLADFKKLIQAPLPCSTIGWTLLGIPATVYNALFYTGLLLYSVTCSLFSRSQ